MLNVRQRVSVAALIISILAGAIASALVVGRQARLVDVLTVFCSGFAGGASLVSFIIRGKAKE